MALNAQREPSDGTIASEGGTSYLSGMRPREAGSAGTLEPSSYLIKPVLRALEVLTLVAESDQELRLTQVATAMALPKSSALRYLRTLSAAGFLHHDPSTDRYGMGTRLWELGQRARGRRSIRQLATPVMRDLRDLFDETVNLAVLDGPEIVYIELFESRRGLRMQTTLGAREPVHSTALGKALLAFLPEAEVTAHLPDRLEPRTGHTLTRLADLRRDLEKTRERGYAIDEGENDEGVVCFGAPILEAGGRPLAALSVSVPASRLSDQLRADISTEIAERARGLSQHLGWQAATPNGR